MFDETSSAWINIFKIYTKIAFWLHVAIAVILCFFIWDGTYFYSLTDSYFIDGVIILLGGLLFAFVHLVVNMLLIQFLNNVQVIRERVSMGFNSYSSTYRSGSSSTSYLSSAAVTSQNFDTSKSFNEQLTHYGTCSDCGADNTKVVNTPNGSLCYECYQTYCRMHNR